MANGMGGQSFMSKNSKIVTENEDTSSQVRSPKHHAWPALFLVLSLSPTWHLSIIPGMKACIFQTTGSRWGWHSCPSPPPAGVYPNASPPAV